MVIRFFYELAAKLLLSCARRRHRLRRHANLALPRERYDGEEQRAYTGDVIDDPEGLGRGILNVIEGYPHRNLLKSLALKAP